jgi:hypothetical protein
MEVNEMEQDVTMNIRMSAEMKKALLVHAKKFYGLPASQVIRFLIANELGDEGIKLSGAWITAKPKASNNLTITQGVNKTIKWARGSGKGAKNGR